MRAGQGAHQIRHEDEGTAQHADHHQLPLGGGFGDLLAQGGHPLGDVFRRNELAQLGVLTHVPRFSLPAGPAGECKRVRPREPGGPRRCLS